MAVNRKTQKTAEERRISQIGDFKKRIGGVMELPSGLIVKVRNPGGLQAFLSSGLIPNSLMAIIQDALKSGKQAEPEDIVKNGEIDPQMLADMSALMDGVAMKCIVEPRIHRVPTVEDLQRYNLAHEDAPIDDPEELRADDKLYVDELPDDDKQFVFQWVSGGTRDLEQFRKEHDGHVDSLAAVAVAQSSAASTDGVDNR